MSVHRSLIVTAFAVASTLVTVGATPDAGAAPPTDDVQVYPLQVEFTEVFLVKGASGKLIMIEAGVPNAGAAMEKQIRGLGFDPQDLGLVIITHGHGDHAGSARYFQEKFHVPVAGSAHDVDKFSSGKSELAKAASIGPWGERLRPISDLAYPPFSLDVVVNDKPVDLAPYGVRGKIIPLPGHTPGSLVVQVGRNLFAGDLFRGTFKPQGQALVPDGHHPTEHFFHEDRGLARRQLAPFLRLLTPTITTVWPTHWGPVTAAELRAYVRDLPLLDELSTLQTQILDDIVHKRSALVARHLADDASLIPLVGGAIDKPAFITGFIENPAVKIDAIVPEDFRIVHATRTSAVMTYKESITFSGQAQAMHGLVTLVFAKVGKTWMVVSVQATSVPG